MTIEVLIADDETLMRQGLRVFVNSDARTTVVGEATDGNMAVQLCDELSPDVVLMDIQMPNLNGIEATAEITKRFPNIQVLALTVFASEPHVVSILRAGASGYMVKDTTPERLVEAIVDIHEGKAVLSAAIASQLISAVRSQSPVNVDAGLNGSEPQLDVSFTEREHSILQLLAQGMSNAEMAEELGLAEGTIKANFGRIMSKLDVRDRVQVLLQAAKLGVISID